MTKMMTRETKIERLAREEAENVLRLEALKAEYPNKLMSTLARAHVHDCNVVPFITEFAIQNEEEIFRIAYHFSEESNKILDDLIWVLDRLEERQREELRQARNNALDKLTYEEKKLLGLKYFNICFWLVYKEHVTKGET
jgi:hypothetical protein